ADAAGLAEARAVEVVAHRREVAALLAVLRARLAHELGVLGTRAREQARQEEALLLLLVMSVDLFLEEGEQAADRLAHERTVALAVFERPPEASIDARDRAVLAGEFSNALHDVVPLTAPIAIMASYGHGGASCGFVHARLRRRS